jgi:hypothetical protein
MITFTSITLAKKLVSNNSITLAKKLVSNKKGAFWFYVLHLMYLESV